jgi:hypothetical protein
LKFTPPHKCHTTTVLYVYFGSRVKQLCCLLCIFSERIYIYIYIQVYITKQDLEKGFSYWTLHNMKGLVNVGLFINPIVGFVWYSAAQDTGCMRLSSSTEHWEKDICEGK